MLAQDVYIVRMPCFVQTIDQTLQLSIGSFVIELLVRIFEPHSSKTHLSQFCLPSDPEPCSPHYTSHVIRATFDYMPSCYGSAAQGTPFLRLLSKRNVSVNTAHAKYTWCWLASNYFTIVVEPLKKKHSE